MRLRDEISRKGFSLFDKDLDWGALRHDCAIWFEHAIVIAADEAVDYYFRTHQRGTVLSLAEIPCWVPPFPVTFVETYRPRSFDIDDGGETRAWGILLITRDFWGECEESSDRCLRAHELALSSAEGEHLALWHPQTAVRFMVSSYLFFRYPDDIALLSVSTFGLDRNGELIDADGPDGPAPYANTIPLSLDPDVRRYVEQCRTISELSLMFAIALTHCKNVTLDERLPSRQERRESERRGLPITRYKTLHIDPMKQVLRSEGGAERHGLKKALHLCRGHFAHYSEEKPLFGEFAGTFWRPVHIRGTMEMGAIEKDYVVDQPQEVPHGPAR